MDHLLAVAFSQPVRVRTHADAWPTHRARARNRRTRYLRAKRTAAQERGTR